MPSILNATTSTGFTVSPDNSGSLQLATNNGTTAVTIDTSQNVGIGTSSPTYPLHIVKNASGSQKVWFSNNNGGSSAETAFSVSNGPVEGSFRVAGTAYAGYGAYTANNTVLYNDTSAVTIMADNASNGIIKFATGGNSERMRLTSGGNLLVGTNSVPNASTAISSFGGRYSFCINSGSFNYYQGTESNNFNVYSGDGILRGYLGVAGTWTNTSDISYKKDIVDIKYGLQDALNLRPVSYVTKDYDIEQIGFIAQEMEQVIPEVVSGEDGSKGISYGSLVALCVKSIQELKAELDATKAEVAALKGAQ